MKDTENEVNGFHGSPHGHSRLRRSQIKFQSLASLYLSQNSEQNSIKKKIAIYPWSLSRIMVATYYGGIGQSYYTADISIQYNARSNWVSVRTLRLFKSKVRQNKYRGYKRGLSSHSKPARAKNRPVIKNTTLRTLNSRNEARRQWKISTEMVLDTVFYE